MRVGSLKFPFLKQSQLCTSALCSSTTTRYLCTRSERHHTWEAFFAEHRPTWVEIDLDALEHNIKQFKHALSPCQIMAVVKADAYGHGANEIAGAAINAGASRLAVATIEEGELIDYNFKIYYYIYIKH